MLSGGRKPDNIFHMYIYMLRNIANDKCYVGQTVREPKARAKIHFKDAKHHRNMAISRAIIKYGRESFELPVLGEYSTQDELYGGEILWIRLLDSDNPSRGYNITAGGGGYGKRSAQQRSAMSISRKGRPATEAQMKGLRAGWARGFRPSGPLSTEHRAKISAANKGRIYPPNFGEKVSAGKKGKPMHPNALANLRKGPGSAEKAVMSAAQKLRRQREREERK